MHCRSRNAGSDEVDLLRQMRRDMVLVAPNVQHVAICAFPIFSSEETLGDTGGYIDAEPVGAGGFEDVMTGNSLL